MGFSLYYDYRGQRWIIPEWKTLTPEDMADWPKEIREFVLKKQKEDNNV